MKGNQCCGSLLFYLDQDPYLDFDHLDTDTRLTFEWNRMQPCKTKIRQKVLTIDFKKIL